MYYKRRVNETVLYCLAAAVRVVQVFVDSLTLRKIAELTLRESDATGRVG